MKIFVNMYVGFFFLSGKSRGEATDKVISHIITNGIDGSVTLETTITSRLL